MLLAFDTATALTTVAIVHDGDVLAEQSHRDPRAHTEVLVPLIKQVAQDADVPLSGLDAIAVGVGPGAFTGLRVGLVTATALGLSLERRVVGVVTLDALAHQAEIDEPFVVVSDARRREVFWARYNASGIRTDGPTVGSPDAVAIQVAGSPCVGAGETPYADLFHDIREPGLPSAGHLGRLAERALNAGGPLLPAEPLYLRSPDVTVAPATGRDLG